MRYRIELAQRAAAGAVAGLHRTCFPDDPWGIATIEQIMTMPGYFGRIGWIDSDPVGFALAHDLGGEAEILSLGVRRDHRRAGIGAALLHAVSIEGVARGATRIVLEVAADNTAARALYASMGFAAIGHRPNYYRRAGRPVDALILGGLPGQPAPRT